MDKLFQLEFYVINKDSQKVIFVIIMIQIDAEF